jgi:hypothetical protein
MASLEDPRVTKLTKFWKDVLCGQRALNSSRDGGLFLEALKTQRDPATCVFSILSSPKGLTALQAAMRFDTSLSFLNSHASSLLTYLQSPTLKNIDSGSVIAQIVLKVVDPPFFWVCLPPFLMMHILRSYSGNISTPSLIVLGNHVDAIDRMHTPRHLRTACSNPPLPRRTHGYSCN